MNYLRTLSSLERVQKCRRVPTGRLGVEVVLRPDGAAHLNGVQTCGSVHACPLCAAKILAVRTGELAEAIAVHEARGGDVVMVALTLRHDSGQSLPDLLGVLGQAWRAAYSSRPVRRMLAGAHWARRVEVTVGENGWHPHVHALIFLPAGHQVDAAALGEAMFAGWAGAATRLGLAAPISHQGGLHSHMLDLSQPGEVAAEYVGKGAYVEHPEQVRRAALELGSSVKVARGENRTPFEVLADIVALGLASDCELWRAWEAGSRGLRLLTWSKGARLALLADAVELTDEEAAVEGDGAGAVVAIIVPEAWPHVLAHRGLVATLLDRTETADDPADAFSRVEQAMERAGFYGVLIRPPDAVLAGCEDGRR